MLQKIHSKLKNKKGFTLIEMIVVIAIIAVLIALVAPKISQYISTAKQTNADAMAKSLYTATQAHMAEAQLDGKPLADATYTGKDNTVVQAVLEYVDNKDSSKLTAISIVVKNGTVESVSCTLDEKVGNYPQK